MFPIWLLSVAGIFASSWGTQFYITCIEALIFLIAYIIITIIEFKTAKMHGYRIIDPNEKEFAIPSESLNEDEMDRKRKQDILRAIFNRLKDGENGFDTNKIENCVIDRRDWIHGRYSLPDQHEYQDEEDDDRSDITIYPHSYPISPKTRAKIEQPLFPLSSMGRKPEKYPDNVYCDSKPPSPLKKKKMPNATTSTQTFAKEGMMGGAFNINEDFFDNDLHGSRKVKHRKRRNAYYNQVEQEDEDGFMHKAPAVNRLGVIYEEDEHGRKVRKSVYADSDSEYEGADKVPIHHPDLSSKEFNEHSIMGEFDKDEKGNIILLTNAKGNLVCKNGRKVNEKGYLRDRYGHILYGAKNRVRAFNEKELDDRGEIPLPYSWDRYNFNAFDVTGNLKSNSRSNSPARMENKKGGTLTDRNGYQVNNKGFLIDQNGNMVSRNDGEIKLDAYQLTKDGDIPYLYTYDARSFYIKQVMGEFDRDEDGNIIVLTQIDEEGNSKHVDKKNREVTPTGYLLDGKGNVISHDGTVLFLRHELGDQGEIPKILPYSKFNIDEIRGDLEKDENGRIRHIHESEKGEILDNQKRRVNVKGYLIDNEGNILDQRKNRVFDCELIDETGEIPRVFKIGLLRSDSTTSLNRFLEELEKIKHNLGLDEDNMDSAFEEEEKLLMEDSDNGEDKSHPTSENNSAMGDQPSNYNNANLENVKRFNRQRDSNMGSSLSSDDFDVEDPEFLEAIKEKRYRRRIRRNKYKKPKKKDILLAEAYGGAPRGNKVEKLPPALGSSRSSKQRLVTVQKFARPDRGSLHGDSVLDQRGYRPFTKSSKQTLEADTKLNFRPQDGQQRMDGSELNMSMHDRSANKGKSLGGTIMVDQNKDTLSQNSDRLRQPRGISKMSKNPKKRHRTRGRTKRNKNKDMISVAPEDLDKLYGKDVDEFLNESDWDIESGNNKSQMSYKSARSYGDKRIRGLESIYLQRLEAGTKKVKRKKKKPKFRALQDRYLNNDQVPRDEEYSSSIFSEDRDKKESYFD